MKTLLAILAVLGMFKPGFAELSSSHDSEILPASPPQTIMSSYQTDFAYNHDRGFYFSAATGPQWTHSIDKPAAKGIRFGGKINAGWFIAEGFPLCLSAWGSFLEEASTIAIGPGFAYFFNQINVGIDASFGIARVFNALEKAEIKNFSETVLATNLSIGKFWWLSEKTSLGVCLATGIHGLTLSEAKISTLGWHVGLGLAFVLG